jgi:uncharacterized protein (TIGR00369 family)
VAAFDWDSNVCFVCGSAGDGLHVRFGGNADQVQADVVVPSPYQGFGGMVHGGILAGICDDAMWHVIHQQHDDYPVTAELTVRYHKPVRVDQPLRIVGEMVSYRRRLMVARAVIFDGSGEKVVSAEGRFMPVREDPSSSA